MRRLALLSLLLVACFPRASTPDAERERAARELEGQRRWLGVAVYVGPFFGDSTKLLASDRPFSELELLESPGGRVITPPPATRVLIPGTAARIARVEFPTGWTIAKRVVMTPRHHPWVFLQIADEPRPVVLVLPRDLESAEQVRLELDRWLAPVDPAPVVAGLPEEHRRAISAKRLVEDMSPRAVEMAWGYPERKVVDRPAGTEEWTWAGDKRRAWFKEGKLLRWEPLQGA
jgi:hypothetical protein